MITSFSTFDVDAPEQGALPVKGISEKKAITLTHKNNIFSIGFAALSYREANKNQYAYQMEGFNDSWIPLGTDHQVTFTNLDPGNYVFRVRAANNDGLWNETPAELKITITPPWWKTVWAYLLYASIFLSVLLFWRNYELNRRQLKYDLEIRQVEAEKLQELDAVKSRFFANISHEFRTPLTLILGPVDKLIANTKREEDSRLLQLVERNAQRLQRLINQLLDISKLEAGKMKLEASQQDIVPFIKRIFYAFESLALHKSIQQQFESTIDTAPVYFDAEKMEQIMGNVLSNAFKFTPEKGTVALHLRKNEYDGDHDYLQIEVSDDGPGIDAEQLPWVFDRFYQGQDQYTIKGQGSGIGLALTKELVELHRGKISVRSEQGMGTTVTILLPRGKQHLRAEDIVGETEEGVPAVESNLGPIKEEVDFHFGQAVGETPVMLEPFEEDSATPIVLLVEDNEDMRTFLRGQLAEIYQVIEAVDGQDGLEKALETIPDLIVSDVMMPRMDGLELCGILKNDERTSHIPVILLTAKADLAARLDGLERGADTYLAKPFNQQELLAHVRNLLALRKQLQSRYASAEKPAPVVDKAIEIEDAFLLKLKKIVAKHLADENFDVERFSTLVGMSRSQLFRKIKSLTGNSPSRFIRSVRLVRAKELLQETDMNVTEVAYEVGFSSPSFFSDAFLECFGVRPSEVRG